MLKNKTHKQSIVPAIPKSEVLAKFLQEIGEKRGEISENFSQIFALTLPGKIERHRNDNINKICVFWRGSGRDENGGKIVPKCCFS